MSLRRSERVSLSPQKKRASNRDRLQRSFAIEPLEHRHLLTLLGVNPSFPTITYDSTGVIFYNPTTHTYDLTASPLIYKASAAAAPNTITAPRSVDLHILVDNSGNLMNDGQTSDFSVTGTVVGNPSLSGTILTGKVIEFGYLNTGSGTNSFDFVMVPTGGTLFSQFAGLDIGMTCSSATSTFTTFNTAFTGGAKGTIGSVPLATGNISGNKFNDITGNGFSADDTGLGGVTVNLYQDLDHSGTLTAGDGSPIASTTTTAGSGAYSFNNLVPGTYFVQEVVPSGQVQTAGGTYTVNVTAGSNTGNLNFDDFKTIGISGTKFNDLTGNGLTSDDTPLAGVTIDLYLNGGSTPVATTVTAANGTYSFTGLGPGSYFVQEAIPPGSTQTGGNAGYMINATSGSNSTGNNFSNFQNISISGTKFNDITGDGFSADDTPLSGVTIDLFLTGGSTPIATTVTAANGTYSFNNVGPGTYYVQEEVPAGSTQTGGLGGYTITTTSGSSSSGNNFDDFQNFTISGKKYNDITGNGFSADDTGLAGVTINLYKNGGSTPVASTVTAADGSYSFANLGPGSYSVQEVVPAGSTQTGGLGGYTIVSTSGANSTGNNFDDFQNISISGTKFNDVTGNSFSADDTALAGVTINLFLNGGSTPIASTVTAADGSYSFTNLGPGSYSVQEVVPAGSTQTGGLGGYTVTATSGTNSSSNNFDDFQNISISGTKYNDVTGNSFSADDTGLAGVTINLFLNGGSTPVASTVTATDGSYSFTNLGPGSYSVQEVVPAGSTQTGGLGGYTVTATSGTNSSSNNFDDFQNISISGTKFNDITGNSFSADDTGLAGVTINLFLNGGRTPVASTVTAADGSYSFSNLGPGSYSVQEVVPAGSTQTGGLGGYTVTATSGTNSSSNNFDDFQNISISGTKFNDLTGNSFSSDDVGQAGVTINLFKNGGSTPVASTVTAADGSYSFTNLGPGSYSVQEVVPAGSTQTGGLGGYTVTATSGSNSSGNNFDNFSNISISGTKFNDLTGNGFSSDDVGQAGVTMNLFKNGGSTPVASTVTAADGSYSFTNLGPGSYSVQEVVPAGSTQTGGLGGYSVTATSGSNSSGDNFDNFSNISISGTKFNDLTGNGFSADDVGQAGVTINLFKNGGSTPVASTVTAADGSYSFTNLGPGSYSVQEVVPAGSTQTGGLGGYTVTATSGSNSSGDNFDNFSNISISGTKFNDLTGNGFSADDVGQAGVTINLFKNGGSTPVASTVTAADGSYSFTNLGPGSYSVQEVVPAGSTQTGGLGGYTVTATSGSNSSGDNFDNFSNISISGTKFNDLTGNSFSSDDVGQAGVTINLFKNGGSTPVASTVTAADGSYSFANLGPGSYSVQEVVPAGSTQTGGLGGYTVTATSGSNSSGNNFDNFSNISISGTKFNDLTGNSFSSDDVGQAGVTINLFKNGGSTPVASTVTAADGSYSFANLGPGSYSVQEVVPAGSTQTGGLGGYTVTATSGTNSSSNNFDNFSNITISGTKFNDLTGNSFSSDDVGQAGVTINLFKNGGSTPVASTVTAADGSYSFTNLSPGSYSVQEVVPAGSTQTGGLGGYTVTATSGSNSAGNNFDNFQNITISGNKYTDITGNGITSDDTGLAGVTINLYKNGGSTPVASTVTASNGSYSFTNLGPGTYSVQEVVPAGWTQTAGNSGYSVSATSGTNSSGDNFADFQNISISGTKYNDLTGNSFSADDTPLAGVTINLYKNGGATAVASAVTAANGTYSFTNLGPGTYSVQEVVPAGSTQTGGIGGYTIAATSGTNATGKNFDDYFTTSSISGAKFNDLTGNGFSADDTGLAGVTINLYKNGGTTPVATTVTASNGTYSFTNLGPGTYSVQEVVPAGSTQTGGVGGYSIAITSGQNSTGNNFDDFQNICISGTKYNDITGNGITSDDTGLGGVTINLYKNGGATAVASTVTASNGSYQFANLGPGTYTVQEVVPSGWTQTVGIGGYSVSATSGTNASGKNFGDFQNICISGTKYNDTNGDGNTSGDTGLGGVTINLYKNGGTTAVATTVTASNGSFSFTNLGPGTYTVQEVVPSGWTQTFGMAGYSISATSGSNYTGKNFADFQNVCISGTKFKDITGNGFSSDDTPLAGVTINLYKNGGSTPVASAVTASNGTYSFTNLGPGTYSVQEVVPTGYTQTGGVGGYSISATSGGNYTGKNFDDFQNVTISGTKYKDLTGNGCSSDDTGLGGVTIKLFKDTNGDGVLTSADGNAVATTTTASNGTYSFSNIAPGTYFVQEVVPTGYIQTDGGPNGSAGNTYYTINVQCGLTYTGNDFSDFLIPTCTPVCYSFAVTNSTCTTTGISDLRGHTDQGDTVTVTFTTGNMPDTLTLVSYIAPGPAFDSTTAYQQQTFDLATGTFAANGTYSLTVVIPNCDYQIDFICGTAIDQLGPQKDCNGNVYGPDNANIFYSAQSRLLSADNDGNNVFATHPVASGDFGTTALWSTTNGQNLIKKFDSGASSTDFAQWAATNFANLYGPSAGTHSFVNSNGTYFTTTQVAAALSKFTGGDLQVLSAVLSIYSTSTGLEGSTAATYAKGTVGLTTSLAGSSMDTYNLGTNGAAFGEANNTVLTVMQLLQDVNSVTAAGASVSSGVSTVFTGINTAGNVKNASIGNSALAYSPAQVRSAYGVNDLSLDGSGQTIAIVDAFDNPSIYDAVDTFDTQFGITTGGQSLYNQYGGAASFLSVIGEDSSSEYLPATDPSGVGVSNWEMEAALDVEWVHAMAPGAHIVLVEANSASLQDLMTAVQTAANLPQVSVVSMSWGFIEGQSVLAQDEAMYDSYLTTPAGHQGITFVASTGDYGANVPQYPSFSPNVLAVGGTSLSINGDSSYSGESGWGATSSADGTFYGSGGGISQFEAEPTYQTGVQSTGFRTTPDVSFVADPSTGVWIADTYNFASDNPWAIVGGTSLSSPAWAGLIALADQGRVASGKGTLGTAGPTEAQTALYSASQSDYNSISSGSNGFSANAGYNLVTGLGTPEANRLIPDLVSYSGAAMTSDAAGQQMMNSAGLTFTSPYDTAAVGATGGEANALFNSELVSSPLSSGNVGSIATQSELPSVITPRESASAPVIDSNFHWSMTEMTGFAKASSAFGIPTGSMGTSLMALMGSVDGLAYPSNLFGGSASNASSTALQNIFADWNSSAGEATQTQNMLDRADNVSLQSGNGSATDEALFDNAVVDYLSGNSDHDAALVGADADSVADASNESAYLKA